MHYDYFEWFSPPMGLDMGVLRIGHWGPAMLYVPTAGGDHREFEAFAMHEDARPWIEDGRVQFFCLDGSDPRVPTDGNDLADRRIDEPDPYAHHLLDEVIPLVRHVTRNPFLGIMGASRGGAAVADLWLRHPDVVDLAVSMSGALDGPLDTVANLDGSRIHHRVDDGSIFWMFCGENDVGRRGNDAFHRMLTEKGIRHWYDLWDAPADHHPFWWRKQLTAVLSKFYNW